MELPISTGNFYGTNNLCDLPQPTEVFLKQKAFYRHSYIY